MNARQIAPALSLALSLLIGGGAAVSYARGRTPADPPAANAANASMAVVDMVRLYNDSSAAEELSGQAARIEAEAAGKFKQLEAVPYLDLNELNEFAALAGKASPTPEQTGRLTALRKLSADRAGELNALRGKKQEELTPTDRLKVRDYSDRERRHQSVLNGASQDLRVEQSRRVEEIRSKQLFRIRSVVGQVARDKGFAHVFDANALVYSVNDLTDAVLAKLPKRSTKP